MTLRVTRLVLWVALLVPAAAVGLVAQKPIAESEPKTVTATIEAVDKASRVVTLKTDAGSRLHVTAPQEMEGFNSLRVGDLVSARYFEAVVVRLARPGSPAPSSEPTTSVRRKDRVPGSETLRERTVRATVTAISTDRPSLTVKTADGLDHTMAVTDPGQLNALKAGDSIDITFYESRLVSVERPKKIGSRLQAPGSRLRAPGRTFVQP
jgi:Cu/Ag efflux protein CusF